VLCLDSWRSIYDGQADRAICEFCYENIELAEYDLRAASMPRAKLRRVSGFTRFYVASPIPLLAPVMTATLSLMPGMKF
jgi:hypothetical protein